MTASGALSGLVVRLLSELAVLTTCFVKVSRCRVVLFRPTVRCFDICGRGKECIFASCRSLLEGLEFRLRFLPRLPLEGVMFAA